MNMKATKLKKAAQATASCGDKTRVETTVAIEFAESCKPLMKSKASAMPIRPISTGSARVGSMCGSSSSGVIDDDAFNLVGYVLEPVEHAFDVPIELPADEEDRRPLGAMLLIKRRQTFVVKSVRTALKVDDCFG